MTELSSNVAPLTKMSWLPWSRILVNEIHKALLILWDYKLGQLGSLFFHAFLYVGLSFLVGDGRLNGAEMGASFVGYLIWFYFRQINVSMTATLREEVHTGTLEQRYLSPAPPWFVQIGRSFASLILITLFSLLITGPLLLLLQIRIPWHWGILSIFGITLIGMYGFSLIMGGVTLLFKRTNNMLFLIQILLLFANGTFVPLDQLPNWLVILAHTMPTTQGIALSQKLLLEGQTLGIFMADGSLLWLAFHSLLYFLIGWSIFTLCERKAKQKGMLGHY